ncbi:MAG: DUF3291 domain-containing protein [Chloroflexota bacterium]
MGRVAFYTFGILREERGHPQVQGFFDRIDTVFAAAESSTGFIATYRNQINSATFGPRFFVPGTHVRAPQTLSLWADLDSVFAFAYRGPHGESLRVRKDWFVPPAWPTYAIWWVSDDEQPSWDDAPKRLEHLHDHGPTPHAFSFKTPFDAAGNPTRLAPRRA